MKRRIFVVLVLSMVIIFGFFVSTAAAGQPEQAVSLSELNIGDIVYDSSWQWEHRTGDGYTGTGVSKSIQWIVVDKNHSGYPEGSVTLLSKETVAKRWYSDNWTQEWDNSYSSLRDFLNETFYNQFSDAFKTLVIPTTLPNKRWEGTSYTTDDNVFVLSGTELGGGPTWAQEIGTAMAYFQTDAFDKRQVTELVSYYWTRSPVKQHPSGGPAVLALAPWTTDGWGGPWAPDPWFGVRPAINVMSDTMVRPAIDGSYEIVYVGAENDNATVDQDSAVAIDVLANDMGNNLYITSVSASSNGTAVIEPQVAMVDRYSGPSWPYRFLPQNPAPVLKWKGYEFWSYTSFDNPFWFRLIAYDANKNIVGHIDRGGRYINSINVDAKAKKVYFSGQGQAVFTFAELGGLIGEEFIQNIKYTPNPGFYGTDFFTYTASDEAGRSFTATVTVTVKEIDKAPPVSSATATPGPNSSGWNNQDVEVILSASDNFGVAAIMYKLDEADWNVYQGPFTISSEGEHNLSFYATDLADNREPSKNLSILIDKSPPDISGAPDRAPNANGWYNGDVKVSFTATDSLSGVKSVAEPVTLGEGANQSVSGTVIDQAGNTATTTVGNLNIDKSVPAVVITSPINQSYTQADVISILYTVEAGISGVDYVVSLLDGIQIESGTSVQAYTLSLGSHTLVIKVVDRAGNQTVQSTSFVIEGTVQSSNALIQKFTNLGFIDVELAAALSASGDAAQAAIDRGQSITAQNNLNALINKIQAQSGKKVDASIAEILIAGLNDAAQKIARVPQKAVHR